MQGYIYNAKAPAKDKVKAVYWERNMLALQYAMRVNMILQAFFAAMRVTFPEGCLCGWYYDDDNKVKGYSRVISLDAGELTFRIPDDFDIGNLPEIKKNSSNYAAKEMWNEVAKLASIEINW